MIDSKSRFSSWLVCSLIASIFHCAASLGLVGSYEGLFNCPHLHFGESHTCVMKYM